MKKIPLKRIGYDSGRRVRRVVVRKGPVYQFGGVLDYLLLWCVLRVSRASCSGRGLRHWEGGEASFRSETAGETNAA